MSPEKLSPEQIGDEFDALGGSWACEQSELKNDYEFKDFKEALGFVNQVGDLAEEADHHPDILLHGWNKVRLTLSTHSAGGLTMNDFMLARRVDGLLR
jgi:4a-hydroxytetrahydrobiopterin dehydratase